MMPIAVQRMAARSGSAATARAIAIWSAGLPAPQSSFCAGSSCGQDHLGRSSPMRRCKRPTSPRAWCRPTGASSPSCGGRLWDTINIATLGSVIGIVLALPVAYCAARNTTPSAALVRPMALFIIVSSRSINSLIWALMLVTIVGPGRLRRHPRDRAAIDRLLRQAPVRGDRGDRRKSGRGGAAAGASRAQVTAYGVVPQVMPAFAGISVFRWDINIRESTVLGLVGAGGIGLPLNAAITTLAWTQVSLILLVIIATVVLSEWVSAKVRHAII